MSVLHFPVSGLAEQLSAGAHPVRDIISLRRAVQGAISLEFAVIAPCMTALWSIREPDHQVVAFIHERVFWTLARACQLSNLMLAIGGVPKFTGEFAPAYPCVLLGGEAGQPPVEAHLGSADSRFFSQIMPLLALTSVAEAPDEGQVIETLGQFYRVIEDGLVSLEEQAQLSGETIFGTTSGYRQKTAMGYGVEAFPLLAVTNLKQAHQVLRQLLGEIDGAVQPLPEALAALGGEAVKLPAIWPVDSHEQLSWRSDIQALAALFDSCYSQLLRVLERSFELDEQHHQRYLSLAPVLMRDLLPALARLLMQTPVSTGSPVNAMPLWRYVLTTPEKSCQLLVNSVTEDDSQPLLQQALKIMAQSDGVLSESV